VQGILNATLLNGNGRCLFLGVI